MAIFIRKIFSRCLALSLAVAVSLLFSIPSGLAEDVDLVIVAGQSNAVGYDAKPSELPLDKADQKIWFWWRCGDPPPDEHDSTSGGRWTHLKPQPLGNPKRPKQGRQYGNFAQPEGGFGPEVGLARTLYAKEQKPLAIVKAAFSGTSLKRDWNPKDPGEGGSCYRALVSETQSAILAAKKQKGVTLRPRALVWVQGESDANAQNANRYAQNLQSMFAAFKEELKTPNLLTLVAVNTRFGGGKNPFMPRIVQQQKQLAAWDPRCEYVDTSSASIANAVHFDSKGTLTVGRLFAETLLQLEAKLNPDSHPLTIVTLGDSITKGVRSGVTTQQTFASLLETQLEQNGRAVRVVNVGIGGERTDQAWKRLDRIIGLKPDIVTVMYGTNDSYVDQGKTDSRISSEEYHKNLTKIVAKLLNAGIEPVLMTEPRWADDARTNGLGESPNKRLEPYLELCRKTAREWRLPLVDHYAAWTKARGHGVNLHDWTTDGCHPNPTGHQKIAQALLPIIQKVVRPNLKIRRKLLAGDSVRVVCFGDSVTGVYYHTGSRRAYTDLLGIGLQRFAPRAKIEMINAGISGHTTVHALARIKKDVLSHHPDLVTVMFGLNDMRGVSLDQYRGNLKKIITQCQDAGSEVVLATPNNVISTGTRPTEKLIGYCDVVRKLGQEMNVPVCDCYRELAAFRERDPKGWRLVMSDEIHPNMAGHKRIATALAQTMTGMRIPLDNESPPRSALLHTIKRIQDKQPIRVLAMSPVEPLLKSSLLSLDSHAEFQIERWNVEGLSLAKIEQDAQNRVRKMKPDLVLIAIPRAAKAETDEAFIKSYAWVMNWSLNFGSPTWDCVVVHPSVLDFKGKVEGRDDLVRRIVRSQDLHLIDRSPGNNANASSLLQDWFESRKSE